jgi:hypothetical protein
VYLPQQMQHPLAVSFDALTMNHPDMGAGVSISGSGAVLDPYGPSLSASQARYVTVSHASGAVSGVGVGGGAAALEQTPFDGSFAMAGAPALAGGGQLAVAAAAQLPGQGGLAQMAPGVVGGQVALQTTLQAPQGLAGAHGRAGGIGFALCGQRVCHWFCTVWAACLHCVGSVSAMKCAVCLRCGGVFACPPCPPCPPCPRGGRGGGGCSCAADTAWVGGWQVGQVDPAAGSPLSYCHWLIH